MKNKEDFLKILREIHNKPNTSQRELANVLQFSLGKLNYCLKSLREKGLLKIKNFKKNRKKINYIYLLTPKGISHKTTLTINFLKRKMIEYDQLKKDLKKEENIKSNFRKDN